MPVYEYRCGACDGESEHLVRERREEPRACPRCGEGRLRRIASRFHAGGLRRPDPRWLRADARALRERPEGLGEALGALSERSGLRFESERVEEAMHRLSGGDRES